MTSFHCVSVWSWRPARAWVARFATALALMLPWFSSAYSAITGRWTPSVDWSGSNPDKYAVHLVLLPGDGNPYHSRVLWWAHDRGGTLFGGQMGWKPGNDGCGAFPSTSFDALGLPTSTMDIFCGGHIQMSDGRLLTIGGTDPVTGDYGENQTRIFTPGAGSTAGTWTNPGSMKNWRWYSGSVALNDGRLVAMSGNMHPRHSIFGGRTSMGGSPQGDSLYRFAPVNGGAWWPALIPGEESPGVTGRPDPREGHSAVVAGGFPFAGQVYFGGRKANGDALDDFWILRRDDNFLAADHRYYWVKRPPSTDPPARRSDHCAVLALDALDAMLVVWGGRGQNDAAIGGDPWRLHFVNPTGFRWDQMVPTGTAPSARFGHAAVYDISTLNVGGTVQRMIMFGGVSAVGGTPVDTTVYELRFDPQSPNSAQWIPMTQVNLHPGLPWTGPAPRYGHSLTWDSNPRNNLAISQTGHVAMMYGGALGGGAYSEELWALWTFPDNTAGWQLIVPDGSLSSGPGPRARHSTTLDPLQGGRLYIFGGETSSLADAYVHVVDPWRVEAPGPQWMQWDDALAPRTRQTALLDLEHLKARTPEIFNPATGQWTVQTSAPLFQQFYPPTFLVPGGSPASRIVTLSNDKTYWTDFPASGQPGPWQQLGTSSLGFLPQGGVQYRPGRIMVAGGAVTGQTKTLDASSTSNSWVTSGSMEPRFQHNLVVMPDGKVIAVGGVNDPDDIDPATHAVHRPQIWDPNNGAGTWTPFLTGPDTLAAQPSARTHHSTAILLPDGRILSAGGEAAGDKNRADLYCPPYLFKPNGVDLAERPVITCAPSSMAWGKTYSVQVTDATNIQGACLIRPGATTHAHDQNQRFVPVNFTKLSSPSRLLVTVPATSDTAPPGYYMLFVRGSADGADVPSVARWVQVGSSAPNDACDPVAPAAVADLSGCYHYPFHNPPQSPERQIDLAWTAPADDGTLAVTGVARQYDIRYSYQSITNESQFNNAAPVGGTPPSPAAVGTLQTHLFGNFSPNTTVYIRMKTIDDRGQYVNASAMSNQAAVYTAYDCAEGEGFYGGSGGGGGGGFRARRVAGETSAQSQLIESASFVENSLLNGARLGEPTTDSYRLTVPPRIENGAYSLRIRAAGARAASLDAVRLLVVDHAPGAEAYKLNGAIALGSRVAAGSVTTARGSDLTAALDGSGEVIVSAGEILTVELNPDGGDSAPVAEALIVAAKALVRQPEDDSPGIALQIPDASGWRTMDQRHLRQEFDELALGPVSGGIVRLEILRDCALRLVGRLVPATEEPTVQWTPLLTARSSRLGDVELAVRAPDNATVALVGPDTLRLGFSVPTISDGQVREYFLVVDATRLAPRVDLAAPARAVISPAPGRFALHQNEPNPFRASTTIRFDLPAGSMVRLEVFDVLGRRVRLLANRWYPPGFHTVEWDKQDAGGKQVGPGIYFYRIQAGARRDGKKMLLMP